MFKVNLPQKIKKMCANPIFQSHHCIIHENEEFLCIPPVVEESRHSYITYCIVDLCRFKQDIESSCRKLGCN